MTNQQQETSQAPRGVWLIAGTRTDAPYPCRCHERRYEQCSAAFCPCAGRRNPQNPACCANRYGPADVVIAARDWRIKKMQQGH